MLQEMSCTELYSEWCVIILGNNDDLFYTITLKKYQPKNLTGTGVCTDFTKRYPDTA